MVLAAVVEAIMGGETTTEMVVLLVQIEIIMVETVHGHTKLPEGLYM